MMKLIRRAMNAICAAALVAGLAACGPSQEEQMAAQRKADFESLQAAKAELDAMRAELAALEAQAAETATEVADVAEEAAEAEAAAEDLGKQAAELRTKVDEKSNEYVGAVVKFINDDPPVVGEPLTETQNAAIRLKSAEDMLIAQDHIDRGGDYRRAITIYEDALNVDPDNEDLKAALAQAQADRFVTQERFAQVKKGMTEKEVREVLGQVFYRNIRDYPDRKLRAWYYPKNEAGDAAAVYFREDKKKGYRVYNLEFEAVKAGEGVGA